MATAPLDYVGPVPSAEYWGKSKRVPTELEGVEVWNAKEYITTYAKRDVFATMLVAIAYYDAMNILTEGGNALTQLTIPGVAWAVFSKELCALPEGEDVQVVKMVEEDKFIRRAILGGRSIVNKSHYQTKEKELWAEMERTFVEIPEWEKRSKAIKEEMEGQLDKVVNAKIDEAFKLFIEEYPSVLSDIKHRKELLEKFKATHNYLVDQDANSLYSTAMSKYAYPVGEAERIPADDYTNIMDAIHTNTYNHLAIIECDVEYPDKTKGVYFPVMATRPDKEGVNRYTFEDQHVWRCSVDLMEAVKYNGLRIVRITRGLVWKKKAFIFKDIVEKLYAERNRYKKEGKDALQQVIKLILNSAYGKLCERIKESETVFYNTDQQTELDEVFMKGNFLSYTDFGNRLLVQQLKKSTNKDIKMPSHLGVFVLAYARLIMNNAIASVDGFNSLENTCYYMDTDSSFINAKSEAMMKEAGLLGKDLGQFKSDLKGVEDGMIVEGIFVAPKLYYLRYIGITTYGLPIISTLKKSKGTTTETMTREDYYKMMLGEEVEVLDQFQMRRKIGSSDGTGIFSVSLPKKLNQRQWEGKMCHPHPDYHQVWLPHGMVV
jgi:hypothetical protein